MKSGLVYGTVLLFIFILISGAMIVFNEKYENMFRFDFSPKGTAAELARQDSIKNAHLRDSLKLIEDKKLQQEHHGDSTKVDSEESLHLTGTVSDPTAKNEEKKPAEEKPKGKKDEPQVKSPVYSSFMKDTAYASWKRTTLSLYENMNPKLVAKVITGFSDDIARDLIYSMKKKKAAEVLSYLTPEQVARYTRAQ